ncbi:MAG TPA: protein-L-isoaspartate(D-aspartate) O-methyltransferase [Candidatus Saccharimonadia bacterium]|nr:protein-L-isoaspartate(D-aspartate) O-methyltransferase [Candidatus Saccharimonadia bacterium]
MTSMRARDRLMERLRAEGIHDARVIDALRRVPRHLFVDEGLESRAYEDTALPIGLGQTISQPFVVALMTQAILAERAPARVLEVGTGSGYQAAVLAQLVEQVFTVERIEKLLRQARRRFLHAGYANIKAKHGDGRLGWREEAPFDAIVVTAAGDFIDQALLDQLAPGGVLIAPVGVPGDQKLVRVRRGDDGYARETLEAVAFVPLLGGVV